MKTILVPTDFSEEANRAQEFAVRLARKFSAKLVLLHVLELPSGSLLTTGEVALNQEGIEAIYTSRLMEAVENTLAGKEAEVAESGIEVSSHIRSGNIYRHIQKMTEETQADIIVMGSKGVSGWKEAFYGSNAEKVIRRSKVPVFTIKEPADPELFTNLVFAVGEADDKAVPIVKMIQEKLGLKCHLLKVHTTFKYTANAETSKKELEAFARRNNFSNYSLQVIDAPWVEDAILSFAAENDMHMIAMGTHGYTGLAHFLNGSRAEDTANHASVPVLTIRTDY